MTRSKIAASLILLAVCSTPFALAAPNVISRSQGDRNEEAVLRYLRPVLQSSRAAGRIYYRADCQADDDYPIPFPQIVLQPPRRRMEGVSAIQDIFRNSKGVGVSNTEPGLIRIGIGNFPEALLRTKILNMVLKPEEQYDVQSAFRAIENTTEFQQVLRKLGVRGIPRPYNLPIQSPVEGLPHLPPSLTNITVDRALDGVAKTFGIVVVFGYCDSPPTYDLTYTGTREW
jgi:hypothetical protein